jgi:pilus assembly protein CpaD
MRLKTSLPLLAATALLAACGPVNRGVESINQPVVSRTDYVFDLPSGFGDADQRRLTAWFDSLHLSYGDRVALDDSSHDPGNRAALAHVLQKYGLLLDDDTAPVTAGSGSITGVRVVVSRSSASVPHCPNWDRPSVPEYAASTTSNYGCATNSNLAAMIADPEDLLHGREGNGTDAETSAKGIKSYRDAEPTGKAGLKSDTTKGGQ